MNLDFSDDQTILKEEARKLLAGCCPVTLVRSVLEDPEQRFSADLWKQISAMGWPALTIPERFGGLGMGPVELCALAEELGRALAPLPFGSTMYAFAPAVELFGTEDQKEELLTGIATGEVLGCLATAERPGIASGTDIETRIADGRLSGVKLPVTDGSIASHAIVLAAGDHGPTLVMADLSAAGVTREPLTSLDPTRDIACLSFDATPGSVLGVAGKGLAALDAILDRAAVPIAFEQIGGADRCLEIARDYALERRAFGRLIGSYQAVKHKLADVYVANQLARSNAYFGASVLAGGTDALPRAAAAARVSATDAYSLASKEMIQTLGGIGATWEADSHLYYRRAKQLSVVLGNSALWRERLATAIEHDF